MVIKMVEEERRAVNISDIRVKMSRRIVVRTIIVVVVAAGISIVIRMLALVGCPVVINISSSSSNNLRLLLLVVECSKDRHMIKPHQAIRISWQRPRGCLHSLVHALGLGHVEYLHLLRHLARIVTISSSTIRHSNLLLLLLQVLYHPHAVYQSTPRVNVHDTHTSNYSDTVIKLDQ